MPTQETEGPEHCRVEEHKESEREGAYEVKARLGGQERSMGTGFRAGRVAVCQGEPWTEVKRREVSKPAWTPLIFTPHGTRRSRLSGIGPEVAGGHDPRRLGCGGITPFGSIQQISGRCSGDGKVTIGSHGLDVWIPSNATENNCEIIIACGIYQAPILCPPTLVAGRPLQSQRQQGCETTGSTREGGGCEKEEGKGKGEYRCKIRRRRMCCS